jgi:apolipoprotein N-acyltransferase
MTAAFAAGLIFHLGTLYWIYPTCRMGGVNVFFSGVALLSLAGYLSLYWGLYGWAAHRVAAARPWARPFLWAAGWVALEYVVAHAFTGFPWLPLGLTQWRVPVHLPLARWGGVYAVSCLVMLFNGVLTQAVFPLLSRRRAALPGVGALVVLIALSAYLHRHPAGVPGAPVTVALVQGDIDQYRKWDRSAVDDIVAAYTDLTRRAFALKPDLVVWPETAAPGWVPNDPVLTRWVSGLAREGRVWLLAGAASRRAEGDFNAVFLFAPDGRPVMDYRKQHLVPFGEFVPAQGILGRWVGVLNELGGFSRGPEAVVMTAGGAPFGVSICYEDIFPRDVRAFARRGARFHVNVTNDGWYLRTAAPEQHFAHAVLRAVETGQWVARATNTGISGFIAPDGQVRARTALMEPALVVETLTPMEGRTPYVRWGDVFAWACWAGVVGVCVRRRASVVDPPGNC